MVNIYKLIQRQFQRYDLIKKALIFNRKPTVKPVITVSREPGSGGRVIAQLVASKMGFAYYDRNLIDLIASQLHLTKEIITDLDEQIENNLATIIRSLFGQEPLPKQDYIRALSRTVLTIAEKGSAVIVGRGANFIIPSGRCLRIRITAPLLIRIKNNMIYDHETESEARRSISKIHLNRKEFCQKYFSKNISRADYYDLVINTKDISLPKAARLVVKKYHDLFRF